MEFLISNTPMQKDFTIGKFCAKYPYQELLGAWMYLCVLKGPE